MWHPASKVTIELEIHADQDRGRLESGERIRRSARGRAAASDVRADAGQRESLRRFGGAMKAHRRRDVIRAIRGNDPKDQKTANEIP